MNASRVNRKEITGLDKDNAALFGPQLAQTLNNLISRQIRMGFLVEQPPETSNSVTLSDRSITDGLGLRRPQISYRISDYTKKGIVHSRKMANLIFAKMGAKQFTKVLPDDPSRFEGDVDGEKVLLNFMGAGHLMGTYRMRNNAKHSAVPSFHPSSH